MKLELDENCQATVFFELSPVLAPDSYSLAVRLEDYMTHKVSMLLDKQAGVCAFQVIENRAKFFGVADLRAEAYQRIPGSVKQDR
jgi:hypothetical protein